MTKRKKEGWEIVLEQQDEELRRRDPVAYARLMGDRDDWEASKTAYGHLLRAHIRELGRMSTDLRIDEDPEIRKIAYQLMELAGTLHNKVKDHPEW